MARKKPNSQDSLVAATKSRANFSGHGAALGAAGYRVSSDHPENCEFLEDPGGFVSISPTEHGFESIKIGVAWDNTKLQNVGFFEKWFKKAKKEGVDLDLGCLYELQDGTRGSLQAFGQKFGSYDKSPYIYLSEDERTGNKDGDDEFLLINGQKWSEIKRILLYIYIYKGAARWSEIKPQIVVDIPGEDDFYVTLNAHDDALDICAVAQLENVRNGIKLTNKTEYFPGHEEMDRAFGFGLQWGDGKKAPA
ncbi:MAG: Tellurium resistance protein TerA [Alphaproteobacteria bacterium]|nr:Tellurium resistance protein TerA [Alphaproteobacteria bacterium]